MNIKINNENIDLGAIQNKNAEGTGDENPATDDSRSNVRQQNQNDQLVQEFTQNFEGETAGLEQMTDLAKIPKSKKDTLEDVELDCDRKTMIDKLKQYKHHFSSIISIELGNLKTKKNSELQELYDDIKMRLSSQHNMMYEGIVSAPAMIESMTEGTPIKLKGYNKAVMSNKSFLVTARELSIEYGSFMNVPPPLRLGLIMGYSAMMVHQMNDQVDKKKEEIDKKSNEDIDLNSMNNFQDL